MSQQPPPDADPQLHDYLSRWADAVHRGQARSSPPDDRPAGADQIVGAVQAVSDDSLRAEVDPRLLKIATAAHAGNERPWERAGTSRRRFWFAVAACIPLAVATAVWQWGGTQRLTGNWSANLALRVGYSDYTDVVRGGTGLAPGSEAKIFFSLPAPGYYSLLLLDATPAPTLLRANEAGEVGRHEISWKLGSQPAREAIIVVAGPEPWKDVEAFVSRTHFEEGTDLKERRRRVLSAIRRQRHLTAASYTYDIRMPAD